MSSEHRSGRELELQLRLFGGAHLLRGEEPLAGRVAQRRQLAVLAVLGAAGEVGVSRERLCGLLWPDEPEVRAGRHLSDALYAIRGELGEGTVLTAGRTLHFGADAIWCDVAEFRRLLDVGAGEQAVELYAGPFLDGFYGTRSQLFEEWIENERRALATACGDALKGLAEAAEANSDPNLAATRWRTLLVHDPYNSRAALRLLRMLVAAGDPGNALLEYERHERRVREDLGVSPSADLVAYAERVRRGEVRPGNAVTEAAYEGIENRLATDLEREPSPEMFAAVDAVRTRTHQTGSTASPSAESPAQTSRPAPPSATRRPRVRATVGFALATLAMVAGLLWLLARKSHPPPELDPTRVAVAAFEVGVGDQSLEAIGHQARTAIIQGLAATGLVSIVSKDTVGAGIMLQGWVTEETGQLRFELRALDPTTGTTIGMIGPITVSRASTQDAIEEMRRRAMGLVAVLNRTNTRARAFGRQTNPPPRIEAFQEYELANQATGNAAGHLRRAAQLDSAFLSPRYALVIRAIIRNLSREVDSLLSELDSTGVQLVPMDVPFVSALQWWARGNLGQALQHFREAAALDPERRSWPAYVAFFLGRYEETVSWLGDTVMEVSDWKRLTAALHYLGRHDEELRKARIAMRQYPASPDAAEQEITALAALGRFQELEQGAQEMRASSRTNQRSTTYADVYSAIGEELRLHGYRRQSYPYFAEAVRAYKARVDSGDADARYRLVENLIYMGQPAQALAAIPDGETWPTWTGIADALLGNRRAALAVIDSLERHVNESGGILWAQARIYDALGECDLAADKIEDALQTGDVTLPYLHRSFLHECRGSGRFRRIASPRQD